MLCLAHLPPPDQWPIWRTPSPRCNRRNVRQDIGLNHNWNSGLHLNSSGSWLCSHLLALFDFSCSFLDRSPPNARFLKYLCTTVVTLFTWDYHPVYSSTPETHPCLMKSGFLRDGPKTLEFPPIRLQMYRRTPERSLSIFIFFLFFLVCFVSFYGGQIVLCALRRRGG